MITIITINILINNKNNNIHSYILLITHINLFHYYHTFKTPDALPVLLSLHIGIKYKALKKRCCIALCDRLKNLEIYGWLFYLKKIYNRFFSWKKCIKSFNTEKY